MTTLFRKSFERDVKKLKDVQVRLQVLQVIERVEQVDELSQVPDVKKLAGSTNAYRVKVGNYRLGLFVEKEVVEFVRCLHRREIYRFFP